MSEEQTNQPTGIVGEIVEGLHKVEEAVEHLIHPATEAGGAMMGELSTSDATNSISLAESNIPGERAVSDAIASSSIADAPAVALESGEGAASAAADPSANATPSSAPAASPAVGIAAASVSVAEQVSQRVYQLRQHFWTFEASARAPFIKLLDEIEALVK
ncbi:hypothetical protein C7408_12430 [Paraburkholderia caballeronis]|nr:hypothetical protein C7408_12430 [Paraburkholderia caballeronis]TDV09589.1 hypothetical protein C7406_12630 [Paraburkholderia caballeronis]TDV21654.1 hypothetical protein C7404_12130 [Paraburkholderia caballeronis]